jgi:hypothetical protein
MRVNSVSYDTLTGNQQDRVSSTRHTMLSHEGLEEARVCLALSVISCSNAGYRHSGRISHCVGDPARNAQSGTLRCNWQIFAPNRARVSKVEFMRSCHSKEISCPPGLRPAS